MHGHPEQWRSIGHTATEELYGNGWYFRTLMVTEEE
jgi:hypothetical protein